MGKKNGNRQATVKLDTFEQEVFYIHDLIRQTFDQISTSPAVQDLIIQAHETNAWRHNQMRKLLDHVCVTQSIIVY